MIRWNSRIFKVPSSNFEVNLPRSLTKRDSVPPSGKRLGCRGPTYYDIPYVPLRCFRPTILLPVEGSLPLTAAFKKGRARPRSLRKAAWGVGLAKNHRDHHLTASPLHRGDASPTQVCLVASARTKPSPGKRLQGNAERVPGSPPRTGDRGSVRSPAPPCKAPSF